jgi:hypothetical protein|nr:MAG TPA: hypothetical protein [Caudoviricetes sp.]
MKFAFKNRQFGEWVYKFFSEFEVQEQISKQWNNNSEGLELNASSSNGVLVPNSPFSNVDAVLAFNKNEVAPSREYQANVWNLYPQVIPPEAGAYLVSVRYVNGTIETELDRYFPDDGKWAIHGSHEILAFKAVPAPYKPEEGEANVHTLG